MVLALVIDNRMLITSSSITGSNSGDPVSCNAPVPGTPGTNIVSCDIEYLGGTSGGSGGGTTVTQLQVTVSYVAQAVSTQERSQPLAISVLTVLTAQPDRYGPGQNEAIINNLAEA